MNKIVDPNGFNWVVVIPNHGDVFWNEHYEWCVNNIGSTYCDRWSWNPKSTLSRDEWFFADECDAMQFELIWG